MPLNDECRKRPDVDCSRYFHYRHRHRIDPRCTSRLATRECSGKRAVRPSDRIQGLGQFAPYLIGENRSNTADIDQIAALVAAPSSSAANGPPARPPDPTYTQMIPSPLCLIGVFNHDFERTPGRYIESARLATMPSIPCSAAIAINVAPSTPGMSGGTCTRVPSAVFNATSSQSTSSDRRCGLGCNIAVADTWTRSVR